METTGPNEVESSTVKIPERAESAGRARPFVKWAGGKSFLLPQLLVRMPRDFQTYVEPFLGGGALFFAAAPQRALLNDVNREIINAYTVVRDDVDRLLEDLAGHQHTEAYFYRLRELDRSPDYWVMSSIEKASRLIYLNKTCYNGLYRVNSRGEFNVPFGDYENPRIVDEPNLRACSEALRGVELVSGPFEDLEARLEKGDFVYLDPPYAPVSETANFASYTKDGFRESDQVRLAELCARLDAKGVRFMLSNSDTPRMRDLYKGFHVEFVEAARAINSKADRRGPVQELIVRNYNNP